jgi:hypothetical protein
VTENYFLNIIHTHAFPPPLKYGIALWVRLKEWITRPLITHYLLAESAYREELPFIGNKFTIVENKCIKPDHFQKRNEFTKIRLLFSGTIDSSTGIWEAISLSKLLYEIDNRVELHIVGYCSMERLRNEILNEISSLQFITCPALDKLVGHSIILEEIRKATAGVVFYPYSVHNKNRIPTKIYEYLGYRLPVLFDTSAVWKDLIIKNRAGIELDFRNPNLKEILNLLNTTDFYPQAVINVYWDSVEEKFLKVIS